MLRARIAPLAHLGRVQLHRLAYVFGERRVAFHELGAEPVVQSQHVVQHEYLAVACGAGTDADRRDGERLADLRRERRRDQLEHHRERAGFLQCLSVALQPLGRLFVPPLDAVPPRACTDCGVRPRWPMTGMPMSTRARTVAAIGRPPSSFTPWQPVSAMTRPQFLIASAGETW